MSAYIRLLKSLHPWVNPDEAPAGYRAVAKNTTHDIHDTCPPNFCRKCDFRKDCNITEHPCSSYRREDGQSVVFKRKETA